jgi:hypothetical protein
MPILEPPPMSLASQNPAPAMAGPQTAQTAGLSFEALQAQIAAQSQQLAVFQAQRTVLQRQINITSPGPALDGLLAQRAPLDDQILKLQMDIAGSRAQLASRLGIPVERVGPNGRFLAQQSYPDFGQRRGPDPDAVVGMSFALVIAVAFPLAIAYARRIWRGKPSAQAQPDAIAPRLDRLEQAVEAIAIEVERVAEGQRFVTKVFAERPPQAQVNVAAESPLARDAAAGLGEAKPFLALGAGPIEPIRVQERQAVRQSITPH